MTSSTVPRPLRVTDLPVAARGPWHVYLLACADGTLYTGCTNHLSRRLEAHARGRVKYTRGRLPVTLVYEEPAASRGAALRREAAIKRLPRGRKLALLSSLEPARRLC